jgi:glycine oxidase
VDLSVLVIGAGVAGLSSAHALLRRGARVTLLDADRPGSSSWAGAGILSPLPPWDYPAEVVALALAGMREYPDWLADLAWDSKTDPEYWICGMLVCNVPDPGRATRWCQEHAVALAQIDDHIWLPDVAQVRNPRLLDTLREAVLSLGGQIRSGVEVTSLILAGERCTGVRSNAGEFHADQILWTGGAWPAPLSAAPRVRPVRGQMLLFDPQAASLEHIVCHDGFYLLPRRDGHILAGSTLEDSGLVNETCEQAATWMHARATALLPVLGEARPIRHWAGLRPGSPDNLPLIGNHDTVGNLWFNVGHYRYGLTMAPAASRLLADLMLQSPPLVDPRPYGWDACLARAWHPGNLPGTSLC